MLIFFHSIISLEIQPMCHLNCSVLQTYAWHHMTYNKLKVVRVWTLQTNSSWFNKVGIYWSESVVWVVKHFWLTPSDSIVMCSVLWFLWASTRYELFMLKYSVFELLFASWCLHFELPAEGWCLSFIDLKCAT